MNKIKCEYCQDTGIELPENWKNFNLKQLEELRDDEYSLECENCNKVEEIATEIKKTVFPNIDMPIKWGYCDSVAINLCGKLFEIFIQGLIDEKISGVSKTK